MVLVQHCRSARTDAVLQMRDTEVIPEAPSINVTLLNFLSRAKLAWVRETCASEPLLKRIAGEQPAVDAQGLLANCRGP